MIDKLLIFLHIPKTGGRSLQNIILRQYRDDEVIKDGHERLNEIRTLPDERRRKIRYIQGHFAYGVHTVFPQDCTYITMLRDPVERVISHYYYIKRSPSHHLNRVLKENKVDLAGYITDGICDEVRNDQTRLIAGVSGKSNVDPDEILGRAKENIEKEFLLAGLIERFDESLMLLKRDLGLGNIYYGVRNQTIGRPLKEDISNETLGLIKESNRLDLELYAHVEKKLKERISTMGESFGKEVKRFKLINKPYSYMFYEMRKLKTMLTRNLSG